MGVRSVVRRHPVSFVTLGVAAAAVVAFALYWFAPWDLFVDRHVDEAVPTAGPASPVPATKSPAAEPPTPHPTSPRVLGRGAFHSLEHGSSGSAVLLRLPDGSTYLRFEDLDTSNGPDLRVWLTDHALDDDWHVWDDGRYLDLGGLKGNVGDQNYLVPAATDLSRWKTAVIWCRRFRVGFAVAALEPV